MIQPPLHFEAVIPANAGTQRLCSSSKEYLLMDKQPAVYLLASKRNGTLYVGVTSSLVARVWQHREHVANGFTATHGVTILVWYELHGTMESAIVREKRIKKWRRAWRIELIESVNPYWNDLWSEIVESKDTGFPRSRGFQQPNGWS